MSEIILFGGPGHGRVIETHVEYNHAIFAIKPPMTPMFAMEYDEKPEVSVSKVVYTNTGDTDHLGRYVFVTGE